MHKRDIENIQLLDASTEGTQPVVYDEVKVPGAKQTLILYAHYDGQPVNAAEWAKGLQPFDAKLYSAAINNNGNEISFPNDGKYAPAWRIYARGASDDKAGVDAILNAYDAIKKSGMLPSYNLKFFFEGEEEAGSTHLNEVLQKYSPLLQSDLWIICDGPLCTKAVKSK